MFTIYPDMVAVRNVTLHTSKPNDPHQWHESILVMSPGQRPETILHPEALELANMKGESHTYSWRHGSPSEDGWAHFPENANIHLVNTQSTYRPFALVDPKTNPIIDVYDHEMRDDVSIFPWWNHWPTAQKPSDGRYALASDHASHCSLTHMYWDSYKTTETSVTKLQLNGLTQKSAAELVPLARSWAQPAALRITGAASDAFEGLGYDPTERAYQIACKKAGVPLTLTLEGSEESPVLNPCLVIKNWQGEDPSLALNGKPIPRGKAFRMGTRTSDEGIDLIVWFKKDGAEAVSVALEPIQN